jgi:hypothetical protein
MSRRKPNHRTTCAEPECRESAFWEYDRVADMRNHLRDLAKNPWRCTRHTKPDEVLGLGNRVRTQVLVASESEQRIPDHLFWIPESGTTGSGFTYGPGFKAYANDFPAGTRLVITARIEPPEESS